MERPQFTERPAIPERIAANIRRTLKDLRDEDIISVARGYAVELKDGEGKRAGTYFFDLDGSLLEFNGIEAARRKDGFKDFVLPPRKDREFRA
ncbi:MAG: hypothetical protein PHC97_02190 [Patescibacteria group bacterium]|nr:hypothetical protein [Patescibacteria group bacterium]